MRFQIGFGQPLLRRVGDQRAFGWFAYSRAVFVQLRVGTERHGFGKQRGIRAVCINHRHAILGKGTRFIRADDLRTAQRFHRGQAANHGVAPAHFGYADGQHDGDDRGQSFRDGGHGQTYGQHEGVNQHFRVDPPGL